MYKPLLPTGFHFSNFYPSPTRSLYDPIYCSCESNWKSRGPLFQWLCYINLFFMWI